MATYYRNGMSHAALFNAKQTVHLCRVAKVTSDGHELLAPICSKLRRGAVMYYAPTEKPATCARCDVKAAKLVDDKARRDARRAGL